MPLLAMPSTLYMLLSFAFLRKTKTSKGNKKMEKEANKE